MGMIVVEEGQGHGLGGLPQRQTRVFVASLCRPDLICGFSRLSLFSQSVLLFAARVMLWLIYHAAMACQIGKDLRENPGFSP